MNQADIHQFAKDTEKVTGIGSVEEVKVIPNVYFTFTFDTEANAETVEGLWRTAFAKRGVSRNGKVVMVC